MYITTKKKSRPPNQFLSWLVYDVDLDIDRTRDARASPLDALAYLWNYRYFLSKVLQTHAQSVDAVYRHAPSARLNDAEGGHQERQLAGSRPARDADARSRLPTR